MHDERAATVSITDRQLQVLELLDRRVPIKVIASELDISQTRVNQHIAALGHNLPPRRVRSKSRRNALSWP